MCNARIAGPGAATLTATDYIVQVTLQRRETEPIGAHETVECWPFAAEQAVALLAGYQNSTSWVPSCVIPEEKLD